MHLCTNAPLPLGQDDDRSPGQIFELLHSLVKVKAPGVGLLLMMTKEKSPHPCPSLASHTLTPGVQEREGPVKPVQHFWQLSH